MTANEYLDRLLELKEKCEKNPDLWKVYSDVGIKRQISRMRREIYHEDNRNIRRSVLEDEPQSEEFVYFPEGEEVFQ